jgi:hypothetical protein
MDSRDRSASPHPIDKPNQLKFDRPHLEAILSGINASLAPEMRPGHCQRRVRLQGVRKWFAMPPRCC